MIYGVLRGFVYEEFDLRLFVTSLRVLTDCMLSKKGALFFLTPQKIDVCLIP